MNKRDPKNLYYDDGEDGISTLKQLFYTVDKQSKNESDNIYLTDNNSQIFIVNIYYFLTRTRYKQDDIVKYDMRRPLRSMKDMERLTIEQHKNKQQMRQQQQIKNQLNNQYYINTNKNVTFSEQSQIKYYQPQQQPLQQPLQQKQELTKPNQPIYIKNNNIPTPNKNTSQNINQDYYKSASYIFSAQYAQKMGQKPRATTSANIGLGGIIAVSPRR
jgi:hypothetical protein